MKISEMTTDDAARALVALAEPIGRICDDEDAVKIVDAYRRSAGKPVFYPMGRIIPRLTGHLLNNHKTDFYTIVAVLSGKKPEEIGSLPITETINILKTSYDEILAGFFTSSAAATNGGDTK